MAGFFLHLWDIFTSILITDTKLRDLQRFLPCNHPDSKLREDVIKTDKCYCSLTRKVASLSTWIPYLMGRRKIKGHRT